MIVVVGLVTLVGFVIGNLSLKACNLEIEEYERV
jgi:hypothetical protein